MVRQKPSAAHNGKFDVPPAGRSGCARQARRRCSHSIGEGVLTREECDAVDFGSDPAKIDFDKLHENRLALLHKAYERSNIAQDGGFHAFCADNAWWRPFVN